MNSFTSLLQTGFPFVAGLFSNFVLGYDGGLEKIVHVNGGFVWFEMHAPPSDLKAPMVPQCGLALLIQAHDDGRGSPPRECK